MFRHGAEIGEGASLLAMKAGKMPALRIASKLAPSGAWIVGRSGRPGRDLSTMEIVL